MNREEMLRRLRTGEDPLDLSIEKWKDIVNHLSEIQRVEDFNIELEEGANNCALCEVHSCYVCPIYEQTGRRGCYGTPYYEFKKALFYCNLERMRIAAKRELKFLINLKKDFDAILKSLEDKLKSGKKPTNDDITKLIEIGDFAQEYNLPELHEKVIKVMLMLEKIIPAEEIELKEGETKELNEDTLVRKRKNNVIEVFIKNSR